MNHSQYRSQKLLLMVTLGAVAILITCICYREFGPGSNERKLASLLEAPKEGSAESIAILCRRIGPVAIEKVYAASKNRDFLARGELFEAILRYDTCGQLERILNECNDPELCSLLRLGVFLEGRMDSQCCTVLKRMVLESTGFQLKICCNLLAGLSDDPETLNISKSLVLRGYEEHRSPEDMASLFFLLAQASYYQHDSTAAELISPIYEGARGRVSSVWSFGKCLSLMPGEMAESLLRRLAKDFPNEISESTLEKMFDERKELMAIPERRPEGWRKNN